MIKTNYHTHTSFCDGKSTAEQMILSAIDKKFDILGFSLMMILELLLGWFFYCYFIFFF